MVRIAFSALHTREIADSVKLGPYPLLDKIVTVFHVFIKGDISPLHTVIVHKSVPNKLLPVGLWQQGMN